MTMSEATKSFRTYGVLAAFVVAVAILVRVVPSGPLAGGFAFPIVGTIMGAGVLGVLAGPRAGIPGMWSPTIPGSLRFTYPAGVGAIFGLVTVMEALLKEGAGPITPFPVCIAVFGAGAVLLETLLRLIALTCLLWLLNRCLPRRRGTAFWVAAGVVALYEPWPFLPIGGEAVTWGALVVAARLFLFNVAGAWFYRRAGFLSALSVRWGEYAVWHVIGQSLMGLR
jgi:hypothetical protein